jgi:hypothetical protein
VLSGGCGYDGDEADLVNFLFVAGVVVDCKPCSKMAWCSLPRRLGAANDEENGGGSSVNESRLENLEELNRVQPNAQDSALCISNFS